MRVTNSMTRTNILYSINQTEESLQKYQTQLSTGKAIDTPSDDPIVAIRSLKLTTSINEVEQYMSNAEDASSWLSITEQSLDNSTDVLKSIRELCVQATSDTYTVTDIEAITQEINQLAVQLVNEGNVSYAGRYIFSGFKTDTPLVYSEEPDAGTIDYTITEEFSALETVDKVTDTGTDTPKIEEVYRVRLGYGDFDASTMSITHGGTGTFTVSTVNSTDDDAYQPAEGTINFVEDTGELIFNSTDVDDGDIAADLEVEYTKTSFDQYDMIPVHYFNCTDNLTGTDYTIPDDDMAYEISYSQDISINTLGNEIFTVDLIRDLDEIVSAVSSLEGNDSTTDELKLDVIGDMFNDLLGGVDDYMDDILMEEAVIGAKVNRIDLTISRLSDDETNYTELLASNEDVDMTEAVLNYQAQEILYNAALSSSSSLMQQSLLDFLR